MQNQLINTIKRHAVYSIILLVLFVSSPLALAKNQPVFNLDNKDWYVGYHVPSSKTKAMTEFVLKGETVNRWSELLTQETIPAMNMTPRAIYQKYIGTLQKNVPKKIKINSRIIKDDKRSIAFEWWIEAGTNFSQHEWYKLVKYEKQTIILRYTTKKLNDIKKTRAFWEGYISNWDPKIQT